MSNDGRWVVSSRKLLQVLDLDHAMHSLVVDTTSEHDMITSSGRVWAASASWML